MIAILASRRGRVPLARGDAGAFLPWIAAVMVYLAALAGIGLVVLHATLGAADRALAASLTLQVPADTSSARLETVIAVLRQTKGVVSEHLFDTAETARLLQPWLGDAVPLDELPVPRLIDVRIDPAAPPDLAALRRQIASVLPQAQLEEHRLSLADMRAAALRIEIVLAAAIAVGLVLTAVAAVFAARAALLAGRPVVELLHLLGMTDRDAANQVALRYLGLGLLGGAIGAVAAVLTLLGLAHTGALVQLPAAEATTRIADWRFAAVLLAAVAGAGLIAMASARITVLRWLARMP